jgi:uncharacterized spore protein YtfJ
MTTMLDEILDKARHSASVRDVYGDPIEKDGITIIPVARVTGVGGGGSGTGGEGEGSGFGYGLQSEPVGVYIIKDGRVHWRPVVNINALTTRGIVIAVVGTLTVPRMLKQLRKLFR